MDFAGNSRAQRLNKAKTKRVNITGVQYFTGLWYCLRAHQQGWCQLCLIIYPIFVTLPKNLHQLPFSSPPPNLQHGQSNDKDPPVASNLSARPLHFRRYNRCLRPNTSNENLVTLGKILTATGGRTLFCGRSSEVDADGSRLSFVLSYTINYMSFHPSSKGL